MLKGRNNILITIILLIFVGQASASSIISCSMSGQITSDLPISHSDMQMMVGMKHMVAHSMINMNEANAQSITMMQDCCSDDSNCSMSGCAIVAVASEMPMQAVGLVQQNITTDYSMVPHQYLSSLYRPPILS